ncbi:MAG: DUF4345 domain-containing protein [Pseudomonadota bacterium]
MSNQHITAPVPQRTIIGIAGLIAASIGIAITVIPNAFYASSSISIAADPNLLSELRAPGANLAALGGIMIAGAFRSKWFNLSRVLAISVFFAFAVGRLVSWWIDGTPNTSIIIALAIEVVIGSLVLLTTRTQKERE